MKKKLFPLLMLQALLLAGCGNNNDDLPVDIPESFTPEEARDVVNGFFDQYANNSAHDRLKTISDEYDGLQMNIHLFQKVNNDIIIDNSLILGRKGNVVWAEDTLISTVEDVGVDLPYTVKGAIKYVEEPTSYEAYYGLDSDAYTYYGTALKEDIDFSVLDVEKLFSLSDYLLAYLITQTTGYIQTYANRKSLLFVMSNIDMQGNYLEYSQLEIAFDWETRLIMHYNYWYINTQTNTVYMTVFTVDGFNGGEAVVPPVLVK